MPGPSRVPGRQRRWWLLVNAQRADAGVVAVEQKQGARVGRCNAAQGAQSPPP